jgi:3-dehydroquinate synthase
MYTNLAKSLTKQLDLPKFDQGNFTCILDTDENFSFLFDHLFIERKTVNKYLIIDAELARQYSWIIDRFKEHGVSKIIYAKSTESFKSFEGAQQIMNDILSTYPSKNDIIINIGGGIVLNIGGFVAGLLLRGLNFIHVPTTLSSQTDVFFGGKQAINFQGFKNQIGFFKDPELCYINTNFLNTIPKKCLKHQMVEGIKLCLTSNNDFFWEVFEKIHSIDIITQTELFELIEKFILLKKPLVKDDPFEKAIGLCNVYGHTLGHAIEMASNEKMSHCEAVGLGMLLAAKISYKLDIAQKELVEVHLALLEKLEISATIPSSINREDIFNHFKHDKKLFREGVPFILLKEIGKISLNEDGNYYHILSEKLVKEIIAEN